MGQGRSLGRPPDIPDHLLYTVLATAWSVRPRQRTASAEVRHALQLRGLSRGVSKLLQAQPLPLDLDFSGVLLSAQHLAWLASPEWTNNMEALTLHGWRGQVCRGDGSVLEEGLSEEVVDVASPLLAVLLANQRCALKSLCGLPLKLCDSGVLPTKPDYFQHADLSSLNLLHLGVTVTTDGDEPELEPLRLPQSLTSLVCCPTLGMVELV